MKTFSRPPRSSSRSPERQKEIRSIPKGNPSLLRDASFNIQTNWAPHVFVSYAASNDPSCQTRYHVLGYSYSIHSTDTPRV
jgi:hypothetical protein